MPTFSLGVLCDAASFIAPFLFSFLFVDTLIQKSPATLAKLFTRPGKDPAVTEEAVGELLDQTLNFPFARVIGRLERTLYMFAAFVADYQLIAGWLVMKAFFTWLSHKKVLPEDQARDRNLMGYYMYLYGNLLSVLYGIGCGLAWAFLRRVLFDLLAGQPA